MLDDDALGAVLAMSAIMPTGTTRFDLPRDGFWPARCSFSPG
jgi:hypothetical protein